MEFGSKEAIVTEEGSLTYLELDILSTSIAANLQKSCGVQKGGPCCGFNRKSYSISPYAFCLCKVGGDYGPSEYKIIG